MVVDHSQQMDRAMDGPGGAATDLENWAGIYAAHIQASATIEAAWIQGGLTLLAGACAILAAAIGARATIRAATRQIQLAEQHHEARMHALHFRMREAVNNLYTAAQVQAFLTNVNL